MKTLRHPRLVSLYAVCSSEPLMIVTEFMCNGSLLHYLKDKPGGQHATIPQLIDMGSMVAQGMAYIEVKYLGNHFHLPTLCKNSPAISHHFARNFQWFPNNLQCFPNIMQWYPSHLQSFLISLQAIFNDCPTTCNDFPAISNYFITSCMHFPTIWNYFPTSCSDFRAIFNNFPRIPNDFPAACNVFPSICNNFPTSSNDFPAIYNIFPTTCKHFPTISQQLRSISQEFSICRHLSAGFYSNILILAHELRSSWCSRG